MNTSKCREYLGHIPNFPKVLSAKLLAVCVIPIFILSKTVISFLPSKFYYDGYSILQMVNGDTTAYKNRDSSYQLTVLFYKSINIFHLTEFSQWSIALGVIGCILIIPLILHLPDLHILDAALVIALVSFLNIYVFTIGKDMIQFLLFFALPIIWRLLRQYKFIPAIVTLLVLLLEGRTYRSYYVIVGVLFILISIASAAIYSKLWYRSKTTLFHIIFMLATAIFLLGVLLLVTRLVSPEQYKAVATIRDTVNESRAGSLDARTLIQDTIHGTSLIAVISNVIISGIRMLLPFELLFKGPQYVIFIVFELLVTRLYCKNLASSYKDSIGSARFWAVNLFTAFLLTSFIFEPDFGSWTRHETAIFPILCILFHKSEQTTLSADLSTHNILCASLRNTACNDIGCQNLPPHHSKESYTKRWWTL